MTPHQAAGLLIALAVSTTAALADVKGSAENPPTFTPEEAALIKHDPRLVAAAQDHPWHLRCALDAWDDIRRAALASASRARRSPGARPRLHRRAVRPPANPQGGRGRGRHQALARGLVARGLSRVRRCARLRTAPTCSPASTASGSSRPPAWCSIGTLASVATLISVMWLLQSGMLARL